jgi:hypothetical protein
MALALVAAALGFPASSAAAIEPNLQFGENGSAAGQFLVPVAIEVGPANGDIYVGDSVGRRINQFSSEGTFIRAWGHDVIPANAETGFEKCTAATGCKGGSNGGEAGQFAGVDGIGTAANGDLFVAEFSNNRVSQFTANGDFVRAWGRDVAPPDGGTALETCTASCLAGDPGSGPGDLTSPNSVAVRGSDVYVTETSGSRVSQFTTSGSFVASFGSFGSDAGELSGPRGVAISPAGNLLVADRANNRVSEFTAAGTFVRAWGFGVDTGANVFEACNAATTCQAGVPGAAAAQLSDGDGGDGVAGIAADSSGSVFLADDGNNRIAQYQPGLDFTRAWGFDVDPAGGAGFETCTTTTGCKQGQASAGPGGVANPADLAVDAAGRLLVVDFQTDRVVRYADPPPDPGPSDPGPSDPGPSDPTPPPPAPANDIQIGKPELDTKKGRATLPVEVPGAGELELEGKDVKPDSGNASGEGTVELLVKPKGDLKKKLKDKGQAKATVDVTFTPAGGDPNTESKRVKLKLKK